MKVGKKMNYDEKLCMATMTKPTREEVEQWLRMLTSNDAVIYDLLTWENQMRLCNSYLALLDENKKVTKHRNKLQEQNGSYANENFSLREEIERLKKELMRGLCPYHDLGKEFDGCTCDERQAAVVEAAKTYRDDLTVENWEKLVEALAQLDGGE